MIILDSAKDVYNLPYHILVMSYTKDLELIIDILFFFETVEIIIKAKSLLLHLRGLMVLFRTLKIK